MTDNAKLVLAELKRVYPTEMTKQEITANLTEQGLKMSHVSSTITNLVKKGRAVSRPETVVVDGKEKDVVYFVLTDLGISYDPDAEEAQILADKLAAKEARAKAKADAKAEAEANAE